MTAEHPRIAQGREAEILAWDEGRVLRLMRDTDAGDRLAAERAAMAAVAAHGVDVPALGEILEYEGRPGLVMERLGGMDLLSLLAKQPWKVAGAGKTTARLHVALNAVDAPPSLVESRAQLEATLRRETGIPAELAAAALSMLATLPDGPRICHGDFHPGNLMGDGHRACIIDWAQVTRGDPAGDFARTIVILRAGGFPPGTPVLLRLAAIPGRRILVRNYEREYRRLTTSDLSRLGDWIAVHAVARMAEEIEGEVPGLLQMSGSLSGPAAK